MFVSVNEKMDQGSQSVLLFCPLSVLEEMTAIVVKGNDQDTEIQVGHFRSVLWLNADIGDAVWVFLLVTVMSDRMFNDFSKTSAP